MSTQLKLRRGTTAQHSTFTGAIGEITIDTDKKTVVVHDGTTPGGRALSQFDPSGSNRIINGAMMIDQRNAGASVTITSTSSETYVLDRFAAYGSVGSKFSIQQNAGSVTPPTGFTNYMGITSLSAYTVGSGEVFSVGQRIEGLNVADLGWGTANAQSVTLSFWVRSSLTGTFGGCLQNSAQNRSYPFSYTISSANTWETKTITVAGDTSGTWLTTNGVGIIVRFGLGVGSTLSGTAGSWAGTTYYSATGATSVVGTNGATFYITGVQLEKGSVATPFEYRPYGTELALCQRYYEASAVLLSVVARNATGVWQGDGGAALIFKIPKRVAPTTTQTLIGSIDNCSGVSTLGSTTVSGMGVSLTIANTSFAYARAIINYTASAEL